MSTKGKVGKTAAALVAAAGAYFLFGPNGAKNRKKVRGWTLRAKGEVLEKLEKMKEVTQESYENTVDKVIDKYAKGKDVTETEVEKLRRELKRHWKGMVGTKKKTVKTTKKKVLAARRKVAKAIAPKRKKKV